MSAILVSVSPGESWAALVEDGEAVELRVLRAGTPSHVGAVFAGRVVALRAALPAALVDIGLERPGFLDGGEGLAEGERVIVEVARDARADKAAGLKRVAIKGARGEHLAALAEKARLPARLDSGPGAIAKLVAEWSKPAPERIVVDDRAAFAEVKRDLAAAHPGLAGALEFYGGAAPLFEEEDIAGEIEAAQGPRVALASGGGLWIEPGHAATMIDVDGGQAPAFAVNLDAARAAARHIRLRNLAGPIVVDFISMKARDERDRVLAALKDALAGDPEKPELLGWTKLGHIELVRRRRHAPLHEILFERTADGGWTKSALTVALAALRAVDRAARATPGRAFALQLHAEVAAMLETGAARAAREGLEARLGRPLNLVAAAHAERGRIEVV